MTELKPASSTMEASYLYELGKSLNSVRTFTKQAERRELRWDWYGRLAMYLAFAVVGYTTSFLLCWIAMMEIAVHQFIGLKPYTILFRMAGGLLTLSLPS